MFLNNGRQIYDRWLTNLGEGFKVRLDSLKYVHPFPFFVFFSFFLNLCDATFAFGLLSIILVVIQTDVNVVLEKD